MLYVVACRLIRRPSGTTLEAAELTVFLGGEFGVFFWGAYYGTRNLGPGPMAKPVQALFNG